MSSCRLPFIMVLQPTHFWHFPDQANLRPMDRPRERTIHLQGSVRAPLMVILKVLGQQPPQMSLVQDDHVVQALATDTPDEPLDIGVLPRTVWGDEHFFNAQVLHPLPKGCAIDAIPVVHEIAWRLVPRERVHHLLRG